MRPARFTFRHAARSSPRGLLVLMALMSLLALLVAGCEYWDNVTEQKKADQGDMRLLVLDAWTLEPLPFATCGFADGTWSKRADASGYVDTAGLDTGTRTVVCSCVNYFDRTSMVDVKLVGNGLTNILLARQGGSSWYPEGDNRNVTMRFTDGNLRFPGKLLLQAYPIDSAGIFQYEWTSSLHKNLAGQTKSLLNLSTGAQAEDSVEFTLTLRIKATLADRTYEAGSYSEVFVLKRNMLPVVKLEYDFQSPIKVGCLEDKFILFFVYSKDPDGRCQSVTLSSDDSTSSLGLINMTRSCGQGDQFVFPLKTYTAGLTRENSLRIRVTDDNEQFQDAFIDFSTFNNIPKQIFLDQVAAPERNLPQTPLQFRIQVRGGNSLISSLLIDWKDGKKEDTLHLASSRLDSLDRTFAHEFAQAGNYDVAARVVDKCGQVSTATLPVPVVVNPLPKKP